MCPAAVTLDGERLHFGENENSQAHELKTAAGKFRLLWQLFRPKLGNTIELTTGVALYPTNALNSPPFLPAHHLLSRLQLQLSETGSLACVHVCHAMSITNQPSPNLE